MPLDAGQYSFHEHAAVIIIIIPLIGHTAQDKSGKRTEISFKFVADKNRNGLVSLAIRVL